MSEIKPKKTNFMGENTNVLFIADDIVNLNQFGIVHNSTFGLMHACQNLQDRNPSINLLFAESKDIGIKNGKPYGRLSNVNVTKNIGNHMHIMSTNDYFLDEVNVIFVRKDPPVDEEYNALLQILSLVSSKTLVVNSPNSILKNNEKLIVFNSLDIIPQTLVTSSIDEAKLFLEQHGEVILKPLFNKGGFGILHLKSTDEDIYSILESTLSLHKKIIVQYYLPEASEGDKRIIILDGKVYGGINRIPKPGEFRAHISRGASYKKLVFSDRDKEICEKIIPYLKENNLYCVGVDVIGDCLIEINFTCPSNILEVGECNDVDLAKEIVEWSLVKANSQKTLIRNK